MVIVDGLEGAGGWCGLLRLLGNICCGGVLSGSAAGKNRMAELLFPEFCKGSLVGMVGAWVELG